MLTPESAHLGLYRSVL